MCEKGCLNARWLKVNNTMLVIHHSHKVFCDIKNRYSHGMSITSEKTVYKSVLVSVDQLSFALGIKSIIKKWYHYAITFKITDRS